jgi:hypothetical protein
MNIVAKEFPSETFETKEELFKRLRENAETIIAQKCSEIMKSCEKGYDHNFLLDASKVDETIKAAFQMAEDKIYPVINTTKYLDSHGDVHLDGIWNQSVKQQQGKVYYVADHEIKVSTIIAYPSDVKMMLKSLPWSVVGKSYDGTTEALVFEIPKNKIRNQAAKEAINDKAPMQNSVRMQYVKMKLALNSDAKEDVEYKKTFNMYVDTIANKEVAYDRGYFWVVQEAKIIKEGSMVPFGSNDATTILSKEPDQSTQEGNKTEPPQGTQSSFYQSLLKNLQN